MLSPLAIATAVLIALIIAYAVLSGRNREMELSEVLGIVGTVILTAGFAIVISVMATNAKIQEEAFRQSWTDANKGVPFPARSQLNSTLFWLAGID